MKYTLFLLTIVFTLPLVSLSQDITYDNVTITKQLGLTGGLTSELSNDPIPHIYRSRYFAGGAFPFTQNGNLVLQPRSSSARNIVFMNGSPTPTPRLTITQVGNVGIGITNPSTKLEVVGMPNFASLILGKENFIAFKRSDGKTVYGIGHTSGEFTIGSSSNLGSTAGTPINIATGGSYIKFSQGSFERMRIADNGFIGIGTDTPNSVLDVFGDGGAYIVSNKSYEKVAIFRNSGGNGLAISSESSTHDVVISSTYSGGDILFATRIAPNNNAVMKLTSSGNVGIGKLTPTAKLHVNGTIISKEIKVENVTGADFVFSNDYDLKSLTEIETFIKANHHLPEVPSAAAMQANGVELGKMNMLLLQKIEELTLLMIELKNENILMKKQINKLIHK